MEAASQRTLKMLHMFGQPRDSSVVILLQRNQKMFQLICIKNKIKKKINKSEKNEKQSAASSWHSVTQQLLCCGDQITQAFLESSKGRKPKIILQSVLQRGSQRLCPVSKSPAPLKATPTKMTFTSSALQNFRAGGFCQTLLWVFESSAILF